MKGRESTDISVSFSNTSGSPTSSHKSRMAPWRSLRSAFSRRGSAVSTASSTGSIFSMGSGGTETTSASSIYTTTTNENLGPGGGHGFWDGIGSKPAAASQGSVSTVGTPAPASTSVYGRRVEPRLDAYGGNVAYSVVSSSSSTSSTASSLASSTQTLQEEHYLKTQKSQQARYQQQLQQQQLEFHRRQSQEPVMAPNKYSQKEQQQRRTDADERRRGSSLGDALNSQYEPPHRKSTSSSHSHRKSSLLFNPRPFFQAHPGSLPASAAQVITVRSVPVASSASVATTASSSSASTPAQSYGLVSRGHSNPLQTSESERIDFFNDIQTKFLQLTLSTRTQRVIDYARDITINKDLLDLPMQTPADVITIDNILMQLRVLREAILSLPPTDFHKDVLIFSILVSAVYGHYQTYTPAFLTLLNDVLPELLDTAQLEDYYREDEFQRVCTIYIYHLVHYADDCAGAFQLLGQYYSPESPLYEFIGCWVDRDYFQWRRAFDAERDPALHRMMAFGELTMAKEALARVGRSYLRMDRAELESILGMDWSRLVSDLNCEWTLEGDVVMIRKTK